MGHLMAGAQAAFPGATLLPVLAGGCGVWFFLHNAENSMPRIFFKKMPLFSLIEQDQFPLFTIKKPNTAPPPTTQQILVGITAIPE